MAVVLGVAERGEIHKVWGASRRPPRPARSRGDSAGALPRGAAGRPCLQAEQARLPRLVAQGLRGARHR
eukprot:1986074-Alexandrium_andersonii.AAC.1